MIGVIDYGAGNIRSLSNALHLLNADHCISSDPRRLEACSKLIFPGVGEARSAMTSLAQRGLAGWLGLQRVPLLGICLGLQLLFEYSTERETIGLGLLEGTVARFEERASLKIPHMGWNSIDVVREHDLLHNIASGTHFYFVHSYYAPVSASCVAATEHGARFASVVAKGNVMGVQFHPEKSGAAGLHVLRNFIERC